MKIGTEERFQLSFSGHWFLVVDI